MRDKPLLIHAVAREPAADVVIPPAAPHHLPRCLEHGLTLVPRGARATMGQKRERRWTREFGGAAEAAPPAVKRGFQVRTNHFLSAQDFQLFQSAAESIQALDDLL